MRAPCASFLAFLFLAGPFLSTVHASKIVLANDEWTLSNRGFSGVNDPGQFALNVAAWFHGSATGGHFLVYSSVFGLTESSLRETMTGAGHTWTVPVWTVPMTFPFDLPTLLDYDGVFLAGNAADNQVLIDYVNHGGNVYLAGGTGLGNQNAEALRWNTFLNAFGLAFSTSENGDVGSIPIRSTHPIFANVDHLYQNNGNDTLVVSASDPRTQVLVYDAGCALYAVYDSVPDPATLSSLALGGLAVLRRKRR
jgi:hypothetical protein